MKEGILLPTHVGLLVLLLLLLLLYSQRSTAFTCFRFLCVSAHSQFLSFPALLTQSPTSSDISYPSYSSTLLFYSLSLSLLTTLKRPILVNLLRKSCPSDRTLHKSLAFNHSANIPVLRKVYSATITILRNYALQ